MHAFHTALGLVGGPVGNIPVSKERPHIANGNSTQKIIPDQ